MDLQYDSRAKQQIKDLLYGHLYEPVEFKFNQRLKSLIDRNDILQNKTAECFSYKAELYSADGRLMRGAPRLVPELHAEMEEYLKDLRELNRVEIPFVLGFINQVLNSSNDLQDYLKILPESIHKPIQELIDSCGCRTNHLSPETIEEIKARNAQSIELMKQRLVLNLLE